MFRRQTRRRKVSRSPAQRKLLNEYGHSSRLKIVEEFVDIDTAKKSGRISFNQMVKFLQKNPSVTHILTEKVDRLYRNFKDYVSIGDLGCTLHLVKDGQVLSAHSRSSEKLQHDIKVVLAKNFIDNLSEEVRKGMTEKAEQGIWPSYAPLGDLNTKLLSGKKGIVQDENRAKLVRRLFEKYATGNFSLKQLAEWAASASLTFRKSGRPINKATIQGILHNLIYTGDFEFNGKPYKGIHEPIISRELWDEAFVGWASDVLRVANADDACLREEAISRLTAESARVVTRLDAMYIDKLEGRITTEMYDRHAGQWKPELWPGKRDANCDLPPTV